MSVLRAGLLDGVAVALAGDPPGAIERELTALRARTVAYVAPPEEDEERQARHGDLRALVYWATEPVDGGLPALLDDLWVPVHEIGAEMIAAQRPGKLLFVAPPRGLAARAALENLARTLSVEWARYGITTCTLLPGERTDSAQVAQLIAYLLSPAGDYFSGCRIELGAV